MNATANKNKDKKEEYGDVKSFVKFLLQRSSINGVSRIGTEANWIRRGIWSTVLIIGVVGCSIQCHHFLQSYFSYPVVVNLEVENSWLSEFPAVTICNLNRASVQNMKDHCNRGAGRVFKACLVFLENSTIDSLYDINFSVEIKPQIHIVKTGIKQLVTCKKLQQQNLNENERETLDFLTDYAELPAEFRARVGHQFEDLFRKCTFNGEPCTINNFTIHPPFLTLGNCFTFNGKGTNVTEPLNTQSVGVESGLHLELNLESEEYLNVTEAVGARISIHDFSASPIPAEDGFNVAPGQDTLVGIKKTTVKRLPPPFKDKCFDYINSNDTKDRSQESCFRSCFQRHTIRLCNCSNPFMKTETIQISSVCSLSNKVDVCCLESVDEFFKETTDENVCDCPLPCEKNYYDAASSFSTWPAKRQFKKVVKIKNSYLKGPGKLKLSLYRTSVAKVRVFYRTLEKTVYNQIPMYQDSEVFSQMGGQLGLWLGVSLIALFECLESAVLLVHFAIRRKQQREN